MFDFGIDRLPYENFSIYSTLCASPRPDITLTQSHSTYSSHLVIFVAIGQLFLIHWCLYIFSFDTRCGLLETIYNLNVLFFSRTLCNPLMDISQTTDLMLYCDILEMNCAVCSLLIRAAASSVVCLGTVLHTKDCLSLLISLLNPKIYSK